MNLEANAETIRDGTEAERKCGRGLEVFNRGQEDGLELDKEKMGCWCKVRLTGQCCARK